MSLHLFVDEALVLGQDLELPPAVARHVQVRRMQPGDALTIFNGRQDAGEAAGLWRAQVAHMGRSSVRVTLLEHVAVSREPGRTVHLAVGMPANDRMDWLVEKAAELGAASLQPLHCERSVLRLDAARAIKRREHWQAVAVAAAEQSGATAVMRVEPVRSLAAWLAELGQLRLGEQRAVLSLRAEPTAPGEAAPQLVVGAGELCVLSGPEGGLSGAEESSAIEHGFLPLRLGPRTLRSETAPLVALSLALSGY